MAAYQAISRAVDVDELRQNVNSLTSMLTGESYRRSDNNNLSQSVSPSLLHQRIKSAWQNIANGLRIQKAMICIDWLAIWVSDSPATLCTESHSINTVGMKKFANFHTHGRIFLFITSVKVP